MNELWTLMHWLATTVHTGIWDNKYLTDLTATKYTADLLEAIGKQLLALF